MKAFAINPADMLDGHEPRIGMDVIFRSPARFGASSKWPAWSLSTSVTARIVRLNPLLAKPIKLTRTWHNILTGEVMSRTRALP